LENLASLNMVKVKQATLHELVVIL